MITLPVQPRPAHGAFNVPPLPSRLPTSSTSTVSGRTFSYVPQCFIELPTKVWWPCYYLPQYSLIAEVQETLYMERIRREPKNEILKEELTNMQVQLSKELYEHLPMVSQPVWLCMGRTSQVYPMKEISNFLSYEDPNFIMKFQELHQHSLTDSRLKLAFEEFVEYYQLSQHRKTNMISIPLPTHKVCDPQTTTTNPSLLDTHSEAPPPPQQQQQPLGSSSDSVDNATVVATASEGPTLEDLHSSSPSSSSSTSSSSSSPASTSSSTREKRPARRASLRIGQKRSSRQVTKKTPPARTTKRQRTPTIRQQQEEWNDQQHKVNDGQDETPVTTHKRRHQTLESTTTTTTPCTADKFNRQALEEAQQGPNRSSPLTIRGSVRREVFPHMDDETTDRTDASAPVLPIDDNHEVEPMDETPSPDQGKPGNDELAEIQQPTDGDDETMVPLDDGNNSALMESSATHMVQVDAGADCIPTECNETSEVTIDTAPISTGTESSDEDERENDEPEPLLPVDLPGRTIAEKLQSCMEYLGKENGSVVGCRKVVACRRRIREFFDEVIRSRAEHCRHNRPPIMYVCGAPGSGKTLTVEECGRVAVEAFATTCEDDESPPRMVYLNCSHLQYLPTKDALRHTLDIAKIKNEQGLKKSTRLEDRKPVVIFILDEIDYLVSNDGNKQGFTKTETYLRRLIQWSKDENYLVGLVGISNSVENEKAKRLVTLGFPPKNKIVFKTYEAEDLTYITLSKIGASIVDPKALEYLSKTVANSSGDARRHLDVLSRAITRFRDTTTTETLDSDYERPIIKLPHFLLVLNQSILKPKDLLQKSPALNKHVLCLCLQLAARQGTNPLSLRILLELLRDCCPAVDIEGESQLKRTIEHLVDDGLLKLKDNKIISNEIRFDEQLDEVESAVQDQLMTQSFYQDMIRRLRST